MGEIERAEVAQLEEELRHLFESGTIPASLHGLSGRAPGIWARHVASRIEGTTTETRSTFDAALQALDSALQAFSQTRFDEVLMTAVRAAEAIVRQAPGSSGVLTKADDLEKRIVGLELRLTQLERRRPNLLVPLNTFAPEPYELVAPLFVVVEREDDQFTATFFDANVSASGDTEEEAVGNLKSLILDAFDSLSAEDKKTLGPEPRRQLAILERFLRPISS